jgi:hypothetical protein
MFKLSASSSLPLQYSATTQLVINYALGEETPQKGTLTAAEINSAMICRLSVHLVPPYSTSSFNDMEMRGILVG